MTRPCFLLAGMVLVSAVLGDEYDYGDPSISYDTLELGDNVHFADHGGEPVLAFQAREEEGKMAVALPVVQPRALAARETLDPALPLCCPEGQVFDQEKCIIPPSGFNWVPKLNGAPRARLVYDGFPKCEMKGFIQTYQSEVHFKISEAELFLPLHIRLRPLQRNLYCIAKVYDTAESKCEDFQTKIFTCFSEKKEPTVVQWTSVTISHLFLFLTLLVYFCFSELRCLQGQYMICFLISLLIYNICLLPGSILPMDISDVSCIALGAVKYFFFCGIFLWFNTICFDIWRTLSNKQDISGRRRFLGYSAYSWAVGAILTTVVLVRPYMKDDVGDDPLKDGNYDTCKLKLEMNMILQIAQLISLLLDLVFLIMASCCVCSYPKFGNGLPRCEASLCLKQGWKLFLIMIAHVINYIDRDMVSFPIPLWLFILLESSAIFGVFAYRKTILRKIMSKRMCQSSCVPEENEDGSVQEKGQLTMA